jgi:metallo-beta-lactamase family protein
MDSFSAHGDRMEMLHFLQNQKNTSVKNFLVHGENESREAFKSLLEGNGFNPVHLPELGEVVKI